MIWWTYPSLVHCIRTENTCAFSSPSTGLSISPSCVLFIYNTLHSTCYCPPVHLWIDLSVHHVLLIYVCTLDKCGLYISSSGRLCNNSVVHLSILTFSQEALNLQDRNLLCRILQCKKKMQWKVHVAIFASERELHVYRYCVYVSGFFCEV
jgi:hypothetical protein